jgi:hypothetical protein
LRGYRCTKEIRADYAAIAAVDDRLLRRRFRRSAPAGLRRVRPTPCACSCLMAARNEHACDTTPLFTSPISFRQTRAIHLSNRTAASPHGLGGFAASYPNCGKQKNLPRVNDMRHNFAFFFLFYFASHRAQKCKTTPLPLSRGEQKPHDDAETVPGCSIRTFFRAKTAGAQHLLGRMCSLGRTTL